MTQSLVVRKMVTKTGFGITSEVCFVQPLELVPVDCSDTSGVNYSLGCTQLR